jgi:hypothetical protein
LDRVVITDGVNTLIDKVATGFGSEAFNLTSPSLRQIKQENEANVIVFPS